MDLKLQELGVGQRTTPIDLFQNELEISEQQSALESLLDQRVDQPVRMDSVDGSVVRKSVP